MDEKATMLREPSKRFGISMCSKTEKAGSYKTNTGMKN